VVRYIDIDIPWDPLLAFPKLRKSTLQTSPLKGVLHLSVSSLSQHKDEAKYTNLNLYQYTN
jgi:hypothetical protein